MEDDDVTHRRVGEPLADPVDQHALAHLERRDHRLARDAVRLDQQRLDAEREPERHGHDDDELDEPAVRRLLGAAHALSADAAPSASSPSAASSASAASPASTASVASEAAAASPASPASAAAEIGRAHV